jgi:(S)-ureidoglycine aminohydrolase
VARNYALLTPQGFVTAPLPGWGGATCIVVISPRIGARFCQLLITLGTAAVESSGDEHERFIFVREGRIAATVADEWQTLMAGGYCYIPPYRSFRLSAETAEARLLVFERVYVPLAGFEPPATIFGDEAQVTGAPFMGDEAALLKTLLPDAPAYDMAVNIFTFQPGATLPIVETHVMEHGLLMIQGQGIYRLDADWHPVQSGDVIWMAPYCPQWFVATGKTPARYIYYKDVNRDPLL